MDLLVFAHRLEAIAFIDHLKCQKKAENHYVCDQQQILICGEGIENAIYSLSKILNKENNISQVINYGVAASIDPSIKKRTILTIRSILAQKSWQDMHFQSYTSEQDAKYDLVSAIERIKKPEKLEYLSHFATLIDREAWGLAFVCKKEKIPFFTYKVVSDYGEQNACTQVKELAEEFSYIMWQDYQMKKQKNEDHNIEQPLPEGFYFTLSAKHDFLNKIEALQKKWQLKREHCLQELNILEIQNKKISPKRKTRLLLDRLEQALDPDFYEWKQNIDNINKKLNQNGIKINLGKNYELSDAKITFDFNSVNDLDNKLKAFQPDIFKALENED